MDYTLTKFDKFFDKRGQLVVFLRNRDLTKNVKAFGQIYFVTFENKGIIRGNHYHKRIREWFGVVSGKVDVLLRDVKTNEEKHFTLDGDSSDYVRLEIGPNIAHAFKSITPGASLINYTDLEWSAEDSLPIEILK